MDTRFAMGCLLKKLEAAVTAQSGLERDDHDALWKYFASRQGLDADVAESRFHRRTGMQLERNDTGEFCVVSEFGGE